MGKFVIAAGKPRKGNLMNIDAITLAAVADEWRKLLIGARIDVVVAPTEQAIAISCYAPGSQGQRGHNYWLYLSAHPQLARAHITASKPTKIASEPPSFVMLLRKYLEGTRFEAVEQPRWERVLEVVTGYGGGSEGKERTHYRLIVELMGRMSNIILCDEQGMILGSLKHVGADVNRYRVIAANVRYVPPPPQHRIVAGQSLPRLEPTTVAAAQLRMIAAEEAATPSLPPAKKGRFHTAEQLKLWQLLTRHLLGFSPLLASEAVYRTTGETEMVVSSFDIGEDGWEELAWNVRELAALYDNHNWHPELVERTEGVAVGMANDMRRGMAPARGATTNYGQGGDGSFSSKVSRSFRVPIAFAPYVLEQYAEVPGVSVRQSPSMNVLIDEYYAGAEWRDAMEVVRAPLRRILQTQRERAVRKAEVLRRELLV
jgi:predicted ribosome quality control (RQC) complex YloA/Tae2 family protein